MKRKKKVCSNTNFDRISDLPESLKHHILSYLPTKCAVKTCILSNSWRAVWTGLTRFKLDAFLIGSSVLNEDLLVFDRNNASVAKRELAIRRTKGYYDFVSRVFGLVSKLDELELCLPRYSFGVEEDSLLDDWLDCAVGLNVKKLVLNVRGPRYMLPKGVVSCKSITKLRLSKCVLNLADTQLPSLRELWLRDVCSNEAVMEGLLANCLNLEYFDFSGCQGVARLKVLGLTKLERIFVGKLYDDELESIKIKAPNILEFCYVYNGYTGEDGDESCQIEVLGCKTMKHLVLCGARYNDDDLSVFLKTIPVVEELKISNCQRLKNVEISSQQLVSLTFVDCRNLSKVKVDTPKLQYFSFSGALPISFVSKSSALKLRLVCVNIYLALMLRIEKYYSELIKLLTKLGQSEKLSLNIAVVEDLIIPENVRKKSCPPLCGVKHLQVEVRMQPFKGKAVEFIESLMWLAPCPESIYISYFEDSFCRKLLKFKYERPLKGKKSCDCWKPLPTYCWRHSLSEVLLETQDQANSKHSYFFRREALCESHDVDTMLAKFFQQPRIDGKMVSFVKLLKPSAE